MKPPVALTIAGSDSGGGAGIQADIKAMAALGVHGASAITAITAQNTLTVTEILELPLPLVRAQIDAVVDDLHPQATKTGMLSSAAIISCVAEALRTHRLQPVVVDPVMVAKGGARLLREDAIDALRSELLPLATVVTPNIPEAEVLLGRDLTTLADRRHAAEDIVRLGPQVAVVKAGHAHGDAIDVFYDGDRLVELPGHRVATANTHGSGCAFSAAIAAGMARGISPLEAVQTAKDFIAAAIADAIEIGRGHGPVNPLPDGFFTRASAKSRSAAASSGHQFKRGELL
jgi:hydroxymethylpyrimidine/phosphomethylpyrimidine kinase